MNLKLNKKKLKNLSKDNQALPMDITPQVGGGTHNNNTNHPTDPNSSACGTYQGISRLFCGQEK